MSNVRLVRSDNEKIARAVTGLESGAEHFTMGSAEIVDDMIKKQAAAKFNEKVDEYQEKLDAHAKEVAENQEKFDISKLEIKPLYEGVLIKPFAQNPFQRIKRDAASGLILDTGGLAPIIKHNEDGEFHEEEQFIHVGTVVEVGPSCMYVKEGDIVFWRKPSETPIPFYKQGLIQVNEHSIMTVVNESLQARFDEIKK